MPKSKNRRKPKRQSAAEAQMPAPAAQSTSGGTDDGARADTPPPKKQKVGPAQFLRQVRDEGQKVTWTSRNETMVSTIMVLIMVALASVFFLLVDQALRFVVPFLLTLNG